MCWVCENAVERHSNCFERYDDGGDTVLKVSVSLRVAQSAGRAQIHLGERLVELAIGVPIKHPLIVALHITVNWTFIGDYGDMVVEHRSGGPAETKENRADEASV
jgi:hypothetical protein